MELAQQYAPLPDEFEDEATTVRKNCCCAGWVVLVSLSILCVLIFVACGIATLIYVFISIPHPIAEPMPWGDCPSGYDLWESNTCCNVSGAILDDPDLSLLLSTFSNSISPWDCSLGIHSNLTEGDYFDFMMTENDVCLQFVSENFFFYSSSFNDYVVDSSFCDASCTVAPSEGGKEFGSCGSANGKFASLYSYSMIVCAL